MTLSSLLLTTLGERRRSSPSRLGRWRPLPRTALGVGELVSGHALGKVIPGLHPPVAILTGGLRGGECLTTGSSGPGAYAKEARFKTANDLHYYECPEHGRLHAGSDEVLLPG